jgi:hypothetical protein
VGTTARESTELRACAQDAEIQKSIHVTQAATIATRQLEQANVLLKAREGEVLILRKQLEDAEKSYQSATSKPPISLQVKPVRGVWFGGR